MGRMAASSDPSSLGCPWAPEEGLCPPASSGPRPCHSERRSHGRLGGPVENGAVLHVPRGACARRPVWPAGSPRPAAPSEAEAVPDPGEGGHGERRELSARPPRPQALQGSHSPAGGADPAAQGVGLTERPAFSQEAERGVRPCTNQRTALSDHCPLPLLTCPRAEGPGLTGAQGSGRGESPACSLKTRALQTTVLRENTPSARPTETAL